MTKHLKFQCWNCPKTYYRNLETENNLNLMAPRKITNEQMISVSCPYCGAEAVVDLRPYRKKIISVLRHIDLHGENEDRQDGDGLQLPDVLPTEKPE